MSVLNVMILLYRDILVFVDSSILITDIVFDLTWVPGLKNQKGADFHNFSRKIDSNVSVKVFLCFVYFCVSEIGHTIQLSAKLKTC